MREAAKEQCGRDMVNRRLEKIISELIYADDTDLVYTSPWG